MKTVYILNIFLTIVILAVGIILIIDYVKKQGQYQSVSRRDQGNEKELLQNVDANLRLPAA